MTGVCGRRPWLFARAREWGTREIAPVLTSDLAVSTGVPIGADCDRSDTDIGLPEVPRNMRLLTSEGI
jgi:hypothetical protein